MKSFRVGSSIAVDQKSGRYQCLIHYVTGGEMETYQVMPDTVLTRGPLVDTVEEAMAIGSSLLDKLISESRGGLSDVKITRPAQS